MGVAVATQTITTAVSVAVPARLIVFMAMGLGWGDPVDTIWIAMTLSAEDDVVTFGI